MTLYEAELDPQRLDALVTDIGACTRILNVRVKGSAAAYSTDAPGLADAVAALRRKTVRAVQVVYAHDGASWCDTLVDRGQAVHLVRSRLP